jgi:hypothetical protein
MATINEMVNLKKRACFKSMFFVFHEYSRKHKVAIINFNKLSNF